MFRVIAALCALAAAGLAIGAAPAQSAAVPGAAASPPFAGTGPYPSMSESAPGLPSHTLYRPRDLSAVKGKLPLIAWANGGCRNENTAFRIFLTEIASHGYVIVAIGPYSDAPALAMVERAANPAPPPAKRPPAEATQASQLLDAINWATAESRGADSPLAGRINLDRIAVMGQSCGGLQAIDVAADPRIKTLLIWNSGLLKPGTTGYSPPKERLNGLHSPIAYFIGGPTDLAYANANDDFRRIQSVPAFLGNLPLGHTGNYGLPEGGPFAPVGVAWLDWQLKGDLKAKTVFVGPDCGLCRDPSWTVQSKNLR